jgi:hypothetical protein
LPQSSNSEVAERAEQQLLLEVTTRPLVRREAEASCLAAEITGRGAEEEEEEEEEEASPVVGLAWACVGGCP